MFRDQIATTHGEGTVFRARDVQQVKHGSNACVSIPYARGSPYAGAGPYAGARRLANFGGSAHPEERAKIIYDHFGDEQI